MTRFWRNGFFRTSMYGNTHWVEGHQVERDDWSRSGDYHPTEEYVRSLLEGMRVKNSRTARFVNPNANCPVCGEPVFFYQNEHGSKVFFDELGPPWPKHPCTDVQDRAFVEFSDGDASGPEPSGRDDAGVQTIEEWIRSSPIDPQFSFMEKYGSGPWEIACVAKRIRGTTAVFLVLSYIEWIPPKRGFVTCRALAKCVREGSLVAVKRDRLSYLDTATMLPKESGARRIPSAAAFIDELTSPAVIDSQM